MANILKYNETELLKIEKDYYNYSQKQTFNKKEYNSKLDIVKDIELQRPPTVNQFCIYAQISRETFYYYLNKEFDNVNNVEQYKVQCKISDIITRVNEYIKEYQISGAILNELNPMLVARINGISEQINVNNNVSVQALPSALKNNVIDLTDAEFDILTE